jgi:hypothetical protein
VGKKRRMYRGKKNVKENKENEKICIIIIVIINIDKE